MYIWVCVCLCVYMCMCECMCLCVYMWKYVCMCVCVCIHAHTYKCIYECLSMEIHTGNQYVHSSSSRHKIRSHFSSWPDDSLFCSQEKAILPQWPFGMSEGSRADLVQEGRPGSRLPDEEVRKSNHALGSSSHHVVFRQKQTDSDAKPLSPHGARQELPPAMQDTRTESSFVCCIQHFRSLDPPPQVSISQGRMGIRSPILQGVCTTLGLFAAGGDARGWTRRGYAQNCPPGHPPTWYCALVPRPDALSG